MTVAFDAVTSNNTAGDVTFAHTPVGTPRGVLYLCMQNSSADQIVSVTYGGVTMSEIGLSPLLGTAGDEPKTVYGYFLGASIPTGAQNVVVDTSSTSAKRHAVITMTAAGDTTVDATQTLDTVIQNPSLTLGTTAATDTFVVAAFGSGIDNAPDITPGAAYTEVYENDVGTWVAAVQRRTSNPAGGNVTVDWTTTSSDDAYVLAVAVKEAGAPPAGASFDPFGMSGFFGG